MIKKLHFYANGIHTKIVLWTECNSDFKQIDKLVKVTTDEVEAAQGDFCQSLEIME